MLKTSARARRNWIKKKDFLPEIYKPGVPCALRPSPSPTGPLGLVDVLGQRDSTTKLVILLPPICPQHIIHLPKTQRRPAHALFYEPQTLAALRPQLHLPPCTLSNVSVSLHLPPAPLQRTGRQWAAPPHVSQSPCASCLYSWTPWSASCFLFYSSCSCSCCSLLPCPFCCCHVCVLAALHARLLSCCCHPALPRPHHLQGMHPQPSA